MRTHNGKIMGRPRKPTHLHVLEGTRIKQDRDDEPESPPISGPPDHWAALKDEERIVRVDIWHEVIASAPAGVLCEADRFLVEALANLLYKLRFGAFGLSGSELSTFNSMLSKLGMTPADRSKVAPPSKGDDKGSDGWDGI